MHQTVQESVWLIREASFVAANATTGTRVNRTISEDPTVLLEIDLFF